MVLGGHAPFSNVGTHFSARRRNHVEMYCVSFTSTWNPPWRQGENVCLVTALAAGAKPWATPKVSARAASVRRGAIVQKVCDVRKKPMSRTSRESLTPVVMIALASECQ